MPDPHPIIEYARASPAGEIRVRRNGEELTITIPPPPFWRIITLALLRTALLIALIEFLLFVLVLAGGAPPVETLKFGALCASYPALFFLLIRVTRVASAGSQPTILLASPRALQISPRGLMFRNRIWRAGELADVGVREAGLFPGFARYVRLQIILTADRIESYNIPWNGIGALANIEDNLRDVLSLPRKA